MQEIIADAFAIVARLGNPTYFITMTCNSGWNEITDRLKADQTVADRPDLANQVFKAKLQQLQKCLTKIFRRQGKIYKIHVIEFQKRGFKWT